MESKTYKAPEMDVILFAEGRAPGKQANDIVCGSGDGVYVTTDVEEEQPF